MGKQTSIVIALLFFITVQAQKPVSFKEIDSTTYDLYLKQDWKSLIEVGKQSRHSNLNFYYLNVRMGIAYYKDNKMLSAVKELEEAYTANNYDIIVQEYLYWAYRFSGMVLESHIFFEKMSQPLKDKINLELPFISSIDIGFLRTSNVDFDSMAVADINADNNDVRIFPESYSYYSIGLNHPLSKKVNFYHQLTFMSIKNNQQESTSNLITNKPYDGKETRYYADVTFALGNRWYLDTYLNVVSGNFDNVNIEETLNFGGPIRVSTSSTIKYSDVVFGASISKASYFARSTVNASVSNLNNKKQFQTGYSVSLFPLGSTLVVPFGSIQYQNQNTNSNLIYSGGLAIGTNKFSITGFGNFGDITNYVSNNGAFIYNQVAKTTSEMGLVLKVFTKNSVIKAGYTIAKMEDFYQTQDNEILTKIYNFNQQNLIVGITWNF
ncbi:hypothetical protein [Lutibacter sp.]|uniref:hypothetical protein n=1 Tax=Lutibacter sp. TaxID=1925666 RepID=UPI00273709B5|nr:hypothetical protein [Lutibacter sp.]MDP3311946.1 hypothetical protein [Lutibacter sp.]